MKQKWWILLTLLLCGCGASSQPDQTGAVQNDRPRLSASTEETAENVAVVEKNENLEKNPSNSNQNPGEGQNWTVFAMDTVMQFDAYGGSTDLQEKVKRRVEELEGEFSTTQENSDIFHLNQEKTAELSADTRYLMQEALVLGAETDGVRSIFRFTRLCKAGDLQREITGSPVRASGKACLNRSIIVWSV